MLKVDCIYGHSLIEILGLHITPTCKLMIIALAAHGPSTGKQVSEMLKWPKYDTDRVFRPMSLLIKKGLVERDKFKIQKGALVVVYRIPGDWRPWLYNQNRKEY